jgi:hypothetical protein
MNPLASLDQLPDWAQIVAYFVLAVLCFTGLLMIGALVVATIETARDRKSEREWRERMHRRESAPRTCFNRAVGGCGTRTRAGVKQKIEIHPPASH